MELGRKTQHATAAVERRRGSAAAVPRGGAPRAHPLQERLGNHATQLVVARLQRKPTVSAPGDPLEREADHVADRVLRAPARNVVQRACRECEEEKEQTALIQRAGSAAPVGEIDVSAAVRATEGSGAPLPSDVRSFFEPRFGHDFSGVRIHTGDEAARAARGTQARAYTIGRDIVFGAHQYAPGTGEGRRLLAHELTHVVQQDASPDRSATLQRACGLAGIGAPAGCTEAAPVFLDGYPRYRYDVDCDTPAAGEKARMIAAAKRLPATAQFEIHGFSSTDGDAAFNRNLACARALKSQSILTESSPAGAGIAPARIIGVFNHGPTPGPMASRRSVVLTPRTPTPLPSPAPAAGATDFQIDRIGESTTSRIYFARGSAALDFNAWVQIMKIRASAPKEPLRLVGYASADEPSALAQIRAVVLWAALTFSPGGVPVSSVVGNAAATRERGDFTEVRSVEILVGAAPPATADCSVTPATQPCPAMDPATWTAFNTALPIANDAMTRAVNAVAGAPTPRNAVVIDRFFGNHRPATLTTLRANLPRLQAHVRDHLPATTQCGGQCDTGGCEKGSIGYNNGKVDAQSRLILCVPTFKNLHVNDQARNLIHESAHGTTPLGGPTAPGEGTEDLAYRYERVLYHLSPADRLRNSDSYALFALTLREVQLTNKSDAFPEGIEVPATDKLSDDFTLTEKKAVRAALAHLEKRLSWAEDHTGQLYGEVVGIRKALAAAVGGVPSAATLWAASWARDLMAEAARHFPLTPPPAAPVPHDELRLAAIHERYDRMESAVRRDLTLTRVAAGTVHWGATAGEWIADASLQIGGDFFRATAADQIALLFEHLARATRDVEPAFVPAYVHLAKWIHENAE